MVPFQEQENWRQEQKATEKTKEKNPLFSLFSSVQNLCVQNRPVVLNL